MKKQSLSSDRPKQTGLNLRKIKKKIERQNMASKHSSKQNKKKKQKKKTKKEKVCVDQITGQDDKVREGEEGESCLGP